MGVIAQLTAAVPSSSPSPAAALGRTWPDVVAELLQEHAGAGIVLAAIGALLIVVATIALFAWASYRRAGRQGASWRLLWGAVEHGAAVATAPAPPRGAAAPPPVLPLPPLARAAGQFIEAIPEIVAAAGETELERAEGRLLHALLQNTRQSRAVVRRAAILRVELAGGDRTMVVQRGFPEGAFGRRSEFPLNSYLQERKGLCWKAALQAQAVRRARPGTRASVLAVANVRQDPEFLERPGPGEHRFESILIGPVVSGTEVLGAICLDSEQTDFYDEEDKQMVGLASLTFEVAWVQRGARRASP